jgi:hypothetical protein
MVYVGQSLETRKWGYQMIENVDGVMRILEEEYPFTSPGEVFQFMETLKTATMKPARDRETNAYGYSLVSNGTLIKEEFGWSSSDEVSVFMADFRNAINEGVKMRPDVFAKAKTMRID